MTKRNTRRKQNTKLIIFFAVLIFIATALQALLICSDMTINSFVVVQDKMSIKAIWSKENTESYRIVLKNRDESIKKEFVTKRNEYSIPIKSVPEDYTITIISEPNIKALQVFPKTASRRIHVDKIKQKIKTKINKYILFVGQKRNIEAAAISKIRFKSSDNRIVSTDKNGILKAKKPGEASIGLYANEGPYYTSASAKVTVKVYPNSLRTPELEIQKETEIESMLSWKKVPYSEEYLIYRINNGKRIKISSTADTSHKVIRKSGEYQIRAVLRVWDKEVKSDYSNTVTITPYTDEAKAYKEAHTLAVLDRSAFNEIASISGTGSAVVPQSFSFVEGCYTVAFAPRSGTSGAFVTYNSFGEKIGIDLATMKTANGSTYNPNTEAIYTVHTHMKSKSNKCSIFDPKTLERSEVKLPRITSGIAYDERNNKYYLSGGPKVLITNDKFKGKKYIKKVRYRMAQDIGAGDGTALVCVWTGGTNYIDVYRTEDKKYLGGYEIPFGEVESVLSINKHLVVLMHNTEFNGTRSGKILITKDPLPVS